MDGGGKELTPPVRFFDVIACKFLHHLFTASENKSALVCLGFFLPSLFFCVYLFILQVLSALDILQPPHLDFFQEMYPF